MANPYASHKLIEMLIEGAIKSIKKAEMAIEDKKIEAANNEIVHAQDIVDELKFSVNKEIEGDIPKQLISTYDVVEQELIQANIHKDKNHLEIALTMLNELLDAWKQITK